MEHFDHIIIGSGIAGVTAAETVKAAMPDLSVAVIGDEPYRLYSRVLLPRYVEAKMEREGVFLRKEGHLEGRGIAFMPGVRVESVDPPAHEVGLEDGRTLAYGKLLIATGGSTRNVPCPGGDGTGIDRFQTLDDADVLRTAKGGTAVVIGAGFIALELLMAYSRLGLRPISLLRKDGFFSRVLDPKAADRVRTALERGGVEVRARAEAARIDREPGGFTVSLRDGSTVEAARVGVGIGLDRNVGFLEGSGIRTNAGIVTDGNLRTSVEDVYAAGDVAEFPDPFAGRDRTVGNWQNALLQGKTAGTNMIGGSSVYAALTSYSINCFGLPIAVIGAPEDHAGVETVVRADDLRVLRLAIAGGKVIGASCAGPFAERAQVVKLITSKTTISGDGLDRLRAGEDLGTFV